MSKERNRQDDQSDCAGKDAVPDPMRELRRIAENQACWEEQKGEADILDPEVAKKAVHELRVHQIELEMQNDELKRMQAELEVSHEKYFDLYDLAPVGYITLSGKGLIVESNLTAAALLGVARSSLEKQPLSLYILPEDHDTYYHHSKQLFGTEKPQVFELRMVRNNGERFWARLEGTAVRGGECGPLCRVIICDISESRLAGEQVKKLLAERELLLKEVHHRIRNNMSTIKSLLSLQSSALKDPAAVAALRDIESRVKSMIVLYDKLYLSANFREVSMKEYFPTLIDEIASGFPGRKSVRIDTHIEDFTMSAKALFPVGIIVNEILTNAMKHAFHERSDGVITVSASAKDRRVVISIGDNGALIKEPVDGGEHAGFGLELIHLLTEQINGTMTIERHNGMRYVLEFTDEY